ncbi:hypothetical protein N7462_003762 [Penicillium macrosclerotiorum]|uniref:uncharacterized protein n=1 Tax=Penicillium macrosclerotiorum TaxID=303699 RepID=UPI0025480011|nr:uncharacterized protein N7462_003762 [Penicillium macrosclerotiorum]KAJ5689370.1 hypothetical protein N7462_003762 [Penicillium macrosclerotiorum]
MERARVEKLAIEERLKAEAAAREATNDVVLKDKISSVPIEKFSVKKAMEAKYRARTQINQNANTSESIDLSTAANGKSVRFSSVVEEKAADSASATALEALNDDTDRDVLANEEHLQLSNEEAFFLIYALGVLRVVDPKDNSIISTSSLVPLFCHSSYYPPRNASAELQPDDPFMISYAAYHHFRSLGWVIRSGVKFGTDYLLYNRGPVFSHAEFAVIIIPSYNHPYWSETEERRQHAAEQQNRSWWSLHCVNRVQNQVLKSLVACYVEVPPPSASSDDIGALISRYRVREFVLRRWVPNRTRD